MGSYLDYSGRDDVLGGGARMIPISTPAGPQRVGQSGRQQPFAPGPAAARRPRVDRFLETRDVAAALEGAGLPVQARLERTSYPAEVETWRSYLLARRQAS